ncbi:tetratricopeptide repeat protein [Pseudomonas hunanensis]|uniref:tetratricopeptide repeat protein n=1 Tax=Pseudomonas hunanensis TaxID=1247546 RepID=UPI00382A1E03
MQGDYLKIVKNYNKRTAYLVFSAMSTPTGSFQMSKALVGLPGLFIYLNDKDNNWYQHGIPGVGESTAQTIAALKSEFEREAIEQIVCIGASMGGYGAALYGEALGADLVICFSNEVRLGLPFSRSQLHSNVDTSVPTWDISKSLGKNEKTKYVFFIGTSDIIDLYNASLIENSEAKFYLLQGRNHFLTQELHATFTLKTIIQNLVNGEPFQEHSWLDNTICLSDDKNEIEQLYELYVALRKREFDKCALLLPKIEKLKTTELFHLFFGMYLSRQKDYEGAEKELDKAAKINSQNRDTLFELAIAKRANGKVEVAIELYNSVLSLDPSYAPAHNHLGMIHEKLGALNTAEDHFAKAVALKADEQYKKNLANLLEKSIKEKLQQIEILSATK